MREKIQKELIAGKDTSARGNRQGTLRTQPLIKQCRQVKEPWGEPSPQLGLPLGHERASGVLVSSPCLPCPAQGLK